MSENTKYSVDVSFSKQYRALGLENKQKHLAANMLNALGVVAIVAFVTIGNLVDIGEANSPVKMLCAFMAFLAMFGSYVVKPKPAPKGENLLVVGKTSDDEWKDAVKKYFGTPTEEALAILHEMSGLENPDFKCCVIIKGVREDGLYDMDVSFVTMRKTMLIINMLTDPTHKIKWKLDDRSLWESEEYFVYQRFIPLLRAQEKNLFKKNE